MTTRKRINLREDVINQPATAKLAVDGAAGIVRGVKVLGYESRNGRRYLKEAVAAALPKYDRSKVNIDHYDANGNRKFSERFGRLTNLRVDGNGLWADLQYNPAHVQAPAFAWWAKNDPNAIGLSHNALGEVEEQRDGSLIVTEIIEVHSVDLVADPATTKGLREAMDPLTVDGADDGDEMLDLTPEPAPGSEGYERHIGELVAAIMTDPNLDVAAKRKKLLTALKLMDDGSAPKGAKDEQVEESLKRYRTRRGGRSTRQEMSLDRFVQALYK